MVPTRYERPRVRSLMFALADVDVLVLDNGHEPPLRWPFAQDARGLGIYAMWNRGWRIARERGYDAVAMLNDDVRILPGTVSLLAGRLASHRRIGVVYPDWPLTLAGGLPEEPDLIDTTGTVADGGMTGFAFVFRADLPVPPFDEGFHWWYGDDAFERSVRAAGFRVCRAVGVPCEHESDSEADDWARRPELKELAEEDRRRWEGVAA